LVDTGYPNRPEFICPYRGTRYHLSEYDDAHLPSNAIENFNYRHSQLRTVIERTFGVVKNRFAILKSQMPYPFKTQARIVIACCLLHNFIRRVDRDDVVTDSDSDDDDDTRLPQYQESASTFHVETEERRKQIADQMRDDMATAMWHE
jgi:hypothetical protein